MAAERPARRRWLPPVIVFAAIFAAYYALAAFVIAVDPYDLYPWGKRVRAADNVEAVMEMSLLPHEIGDPDVDVLLTGDSVIYAYTRAPTVPTATPRRATSSARSTAARTG